jgi:hypothetical protein
VLKGYLGVNLNRIKDPGAEALLINDTIEFHPDWLWIFKNDHLTSQLGWLKSNSHAGLEQFIDNSFSKSHYTICKDCYFSFRLTLYWEREGGGSEDF